MERQDKVQSVLSLSVPSTHNTHQSINKSAPIEDAYDMVDQMINGSRAPACFVEQMYRYYKVLEEKPEDNCQLASVFEKIKGKDYVNVSILGGLKQLMTSPGITKRRYK